MKCDSHNFVAAHSVPKNDFSRSPIHSSLRSSRHRILRHAATNPLFLKLNNIHYVPDGRGLPARRRLMARVLISEEYRRKKSLHGVAENSMRYMMRISGRHHMKCPHLTRRMFTCNALERPYSPSLFELHEYCGNRYHTKCPFFRNTAQGSGGR